MAGERLGCYSCFDTLDPNDARERLRIFIACDGCGSYYHTVCWPDNNACLHCQHTQSHEARVAPPAPLRVVTKKHALPIKPSTIVETPKPSRRGCIVRTALLTLLALGLIAYFVAGDRLGEYVDNYAHGWLGISLFAAQPTLIGAARPTVASLAPTTLPTTAQQNAPTPPAHRSVVGTVNSNQLNVRAQAGPNEPIVTTLPRGAQVQLLDEKQQVEDKTWVKVRVDQLEGWVNQDFLDLASTDTTTTPTESTATRARVVGVTPQQLRVRAEPDSNAEIIARLNEGTEVLSYDMRVTDNGRWQRIRVGGIEGWVNADFLQAIES